jgi:hypothetical protein
VLVSTLMKPALITLTAVPAVALLEESANHHRGASPRHRAVAQVV